jgi:hypothetical protein
MDVFFFVNVYIAGNCGSEAIPEMPRQCRKCLKFPQMPKQKEKNPVHQMCEENFDIGNLSLKWASNFCSCTDFFQC